MEFDAYYSEYMGCVESIKGQVIYSPYRDLPINKKYYYPVIISDYYPGLLCSAGEKEYRTCKQNVDGEAISVDKLRHALGEDYRLRRFYRYAYHGGESHLNPNPMLFEEKGQFVIRYNHTLASRAFVSDVYAGGGNIVVFTSKEYRGQGYGLEVVKACIDWCLHRDILPIYYVEQENSASIALAEKAGFTRQCQEWIIQKIPKI